VFVVSQATPAARRYRAAQVGADIAKQIVDAHGGQIWHRAGWALVRFLRSPLPALHRRHHHHGLGTFVPAATGNGATGCCVPIAALNSERNFLKVFGDNHYLALVLACAYFPLQSSYDFFFG
jgi:hypothetical protein